ncbi:hypothetical protein ACLOJK_037178 [Asimina triloba]
MGHRFSWKEAGGGRVKVAGSGYRLVMERGRDGAIAGKAGEGGDAARGIVDIAGDGRIYRASPSLLTTVARHRSSMKKGGAGSAITTWWSSFLMAPII